MALQQKNTFKVGKLPLTLLTIPVSIATVAVAIWWLAFTSPLAIALFAAWLAIAIILTTFLIGVIAKIFFKSISILPVVGIAVVTILGTCACAITILCGLIPIVVVSIAIIIVLSIGFVGRANYGLSLSKVFVVWIAIVAILLINLLFFIGLCVLSSSDAPCPMCPLEDQFMPTRSRALS